MTTPNKATPEQILKARITWAEAHIAEILPRLAAAEQRIQALEAAANSQPTPNPSQIRSSPAGELMQSVSAAICPIDGRGGTPINWEPEARAAILAVAAWFDTIGYGATASILRQELQHRG